MITALARPLLAAPFIASGLDAVMNPEEHREAANRAFDAVGMPLPSKTSIDLVTRATGVAFTVAGLCLARGKMPRTSALALGAMYAPISLARNPFWTQEGRERRDSISALISAAGLIGGAFIASQDRGGKPSLGWRAQQIAKNASEAVSERVHTGERR
ncbi:DoxX family protein [Trueperella bialowiezensis]|uniref:DoxX n=1 Tax=Trueperella bialowiezensis TaxID=312285 RepID=A0A3S4VGS6_9ACTO|nr:DoxX family protein [Trueperella bialowiezensis]VEI13726.1 DoxX [Trueperella bialowiezensis]